MVKKSRTPPRFASEAEERAFWESRDSDGLVDWDQARPARFPRLKPSATATSPPRPEKAGMTITSDDAPDLSAPEWQARLAAAKVRRGKRPAPKR